MGWKIFVTTAVLVSALYGPASAADPANGRKLAEEWCTKCHNIEAGAPFKLHPPSFASIAVYRDAMDIRGKIFGQNMHVNMPDASWFLQVEELDDLVAYITSLEAQ